MEIRMVETFLKVSATQNFSKAAEILGYSQSAVTVQIQKLERELGVPLFERIGKRAYLTEKGKAFIPYANQLMKSYNGALYFSKDESQIRGELRIGGVESVCTALLPKLLLPFYKSCPNVEVVIKSGVTSSLISMAESNELDLIFTLDERIYRSDFISAAEKRDQVVLVALNKDKKDEEISIPVEKLCSEPFVLTEKDAPYRTALDNILALKNLEIRPILEIGNTETIINLLKKGMGISFLPHFTVEEELKNKSLTEIKSDFKPVDMQLQLLYHKDKYLTRQMEIFISLVKEYFK